ncbi:hypothetical protein [Pengzhenrongella phosphoraccumulans]|uniref:hypothetical protein n=1 Tax=Pengzhenrongella phosphoraccumulans TaxID=3114394 RepID=UPI00388D74F8
MDAVFVLRASARRWYVIVPVLTLSCGLAAAAYGQVEPLYTASSSIVILPSQAAQQGAVDPRSSGLDNPYAGSGGTRLAAAVLAKNIASRSFHDRLDPAVAGPVTIESTVAAQQPIITVAVTAGTAADVFRTLDAVTASARVVLDEFQAVAQAPEATRYLVASAVPASEATDVTPSRWRGPGAIIVLGAGLAALLAVATDAIGAALRARTRPDATPAPLVPNRPVRREPDPSPEWLLITRPPVADRGPHNRVGLRRTTRRGRAGAAAAASMRHGRR